ACLLGMFWACYCPAWLGPRGALVGGVGCGWSGGGPVGEHFGGPSGEPVSGVRVVAVAGAVGLAGVFDPQVGVVVRGGGGQGRGQSETTAGRVAPVQLPVRGGTPAVARGV